MKEHIELVTSSDYPPRASREELIRLGVVFMFDDCLAGAKLPEVAPGRWYRRWEGNELQREGIVIPLAGLRWRLRFFEDPRDGDNIPKGGVVMLDQTDLPETPFDPPIEGYRAGYAAVFGQAEWQQSPRLLVWEGQVARHLISMDAYWGDCGITNILCHFDSEGLPCKAWFNTDCA